MKEPNSIEQEGKQSESLKAFFERKVNELQYNSTDKEDQGMVDFLKIKKFHGTKDFKNMIERLEKALQLVYKLEINKFRKQGKEGIWQLSPKEKKDLEEAPKYLKKAPNFNLPWDPKISTKWLYLGGIACSLVEKDSRAVFDAIQSYQEDSGMKPEEFIKENIGLLTAIRNTEGEDRAQNLDNEMMKRHNYVYDQDKRMYIKES